MLRPETIIPGLSVPALDSLSPDDLDAACDAFAALERIAYIIRRGQRLRLGGEIAHAMACERETDRLYQQLPQALRW